MKRTLAFLLALVMVLSLCACGSEQVAETSNASSETTEATEATTEATEAVISKEELLKDPINVTVLELQKAVYENKAKAKQTYCSTPVMVTGKAMMVEDDHVVICDSQVCVDVYLSIDDLVAVESGSTITVVGIISDIQTIEITWGGRPFSSPHYIMDLGYLVQ